MNPNSRLVSPKTSIEARVLGASTISRTRSERSIDEMPPHRAHLLDARDDLAHMQLMDGAHKLAVMLAVPRARQFQHALMVALALLVGRRLRHLSHLTEGGVVERLLNAASALDALDIGHEEGCLASLQAHAEPQLVDAIAIEELRR